MALGGAEAVCGLLVRLVGGGKGGVMRVLLMWRGRVVLVVLLLACCGGGALLRRVVLPTERELGIVLKVYDETSWDLAFDPSGTVLAVADRDGAVAVVEVRSGQRRLHFPPPDGTPPPLGVDARLAISPDGAHLAHAGTFGVRLWALASGAPVVLAGALSGPVRALDYLPDGRLQAWATAGTISRWDAPGAAPAILAAPTASFGYASFGGGGRWLASCRELPDATVLFWDVEVGTETRVAIPGINRLTCATIPVLSPDGALAVVKTLGEDYHVIDRVQGRVRQTIAIDGTGDGGGIAFAPGGAWFILGGNKRLSIRDVGDGRERGALRALPLLEYELPIRFGTMVVSRDGRYLAARCGDAYVRVWRL